MEVHSIQSPSLYVEGYEKAQEADPALADAYAMNMMVGDPLADTLDYPKQSSFGVLALLRAQRRMRVILSKVLPGATPLVLDNFAGMLQRSVYDDVGISYRMPDAVRDIDSSKWWAARPCPTEAVSKLLTDGFANRYALTPGTSPCSLRRRPATPGSR